MKYFILIFIAGIFYTSSCNKQEEPKLITSCNRGFVPNEDSTECICPKATHYEVVSKNKNRSFCREKGPFNYLVKFDGRNCLFDSKNVYEDEIGFLQFSTNNQIFIDFNSSSLSHFNFHGLEKNVLDNGQVEVRFKVQSAGMGDCYDWKKRSICGGYIIGYAYGISDKENTKIEIRIEYIDCKDKIIDIGYMHLWKE